jgi:hypothetical protein
MEAAHVLTEEGFDVTLPSLPFQWNGGLGDVFRRVVKHMEVSGEITLVVFPIPLFNFIIYIYILC